MKLSAGLLSTYRKGGTPFTNLTQTVTFESKYRRPEDLDWTDSIRRVVENNVALDPKCTIQEAEALYDTFWNLRCSPPGRGLYLNLKTGMPGEAAVNCWGISARSTADLAWSAHTLACGGGVGYGLLETHMLPTSQHGAATLKIICPSTHKDYAEVKSDLSYGQADLVVEDNRMAWADAIKYVLDSAYLARSIVVDVSKIRPFGSPLMTFSGTASGPGALVRLFRASWAIIREAAGRKLRPVEVLDLANHIGVAIKAGGARRSAQIAVGRYEDREFVEAKRDWEKVAAYRHSSNNTVAVWGNPDWTPLLKDMHGFGEPGVARYDLIEAIDPKFVVPNPCHETVLQHRDSCNLGDIYLSRGPSRQDVDLLCRYVMRQRLIPFSDPEAERVREEVMRVGVSVSGVSEVEGVDYRSLYKRVRDTMTEYADELGVNRPQTFTVVKPGGTTGLLADVAPGVHSVHSPYYVRNMRIMKNEEMAADLIAAGVPHEECVYDKTGRTWVFSFPTDKSHAKSFGTQETAVQQLERMFKLQEEYTDQMVSCTVNFEEKEIPEMAAWLDKHPVRNISCLPKSHEYPQSPYVSCSEVEYREMAAKINYNAKIGAGDADTADGCEATGLCPIR